MCCNPSILHKLQDCHQQLFSCMKGIYYMNCIIQEYDFTHPSTEWVVAIIKFAVAVHQPGEVQNFKSCSTGLSAIF